MNDESQDSPTNGSTRSQHSQRAGLADSPGSMLREARESRHISVEQLAQQTRLTRGKIEALEQDDFVHLTEPVYVRGYYRECAKLLGLSATEVVAAYERAAGVVRAPGGSASAPPSPTPEFVSDSGYRRSRWTGAWLTVPLVVVVLALAGWYAERNRNADNDDEPTKSEAAKKADTARAAHAGLSSLSTMSHTHGGSETVGNITAVVTKAATDSRAGVPLKILSAASDATPSETLETTARSSTATHPATPPAANATAAISVTASTSMLQPTATTTASTQLILDFTGRCWVQVTDAMGKRLLAGTFSTGQQKAVSGVPPYSVVLGDAHVAQIQYGGQVIAISRFIRPDSTARFHVPLPN